MNNPIKISVGILVLLLCANVQLLFADGGTFGDADKAIGAASKAVDGARKAQDAANAAQTKADATRDAMEAPGKKAESAAKSAEIAEDMAEKASSQRDLALQVVNSLNETAAKTGKEEDQIAAKRADEAASKACKEAAKAARDAEAAKKGAEKAGKDAANEANNKKLKEAADHAQANADSKAMQANGAKDAANDAIKDAQKKIDEIDDTHGSSKTKRQDALDKEKDRLKQLAMGPESGPQMLASLAQNGKVGVTLSGTGETIGHVADMTLKNLSSENLSVSIPPMMLLSQSRQKQDYVKPRGQTIALKPGETRIVPVDGVCIDGHKPPVEPTDSGELTMAAPSPARNLTIANVQQIITTAQQLQNAGKFTTPYLKNPKRELDTIVQWTTWVYTSASGPNAIGFDDFKKKIFQQTGDLTQAQKTELDKGATQIWDAIQLTGRQAKVIP